jgi:hypothetical protein
MKISYNEWVALISQDGVLNIPQCCVQAHKGVVDVVDIPETNNSMIRIKLPLYNLCMK